MTGRTPAVIGVRDLLYSLCIANLNGVISNKEYVRQYTELQNRAFQLFGIEADNTKIVLSEGNAANQSAASGINVNIDDIGSNGKPQKTNSNSDNSEDDFDYNDSNSSFD